MAALLPARSHTVVFRSKPDKVKFPGYRTIKKADELDDVKHERFLLAPKYEDQAPQFWQALELVWKQGGWCAVMDELFYLDQLGMRPRIERLLTQGRSVGVSMVSGMQRPVSVTRFALGESTHLISFSLEGRDAKEFRDATHPAVLDEVTSLENHEFVWFKQPRSLWRGKLDVKTGSFVGRMIL